MSLNLPKIHNPELVFGIVAPIGTQLDKTITDFESNLNQFGYKTVNIRVTDMFPEFSKIYPPDNPLNATEKYKRYKTYIDYGNQLRKGFGENSILAVAAMWQIMRERAKIIDKDPDSIPEKTAYIVRQFKRKEELELLRSVYGEQFFQISVYSRQSARVQYLADTFAKDAGKGNSDSFRSTAEEITNIDYDEAGKEFGQKVAKIFHDADFIVDADQPDKIIGEGITRFISLLFGSNSVSPTHDEYGMKLATNAALRSIDLSRQVGAAIFDQDQQIAALGSNEVPKAGGGTYWSDDGYDAREYTRKVDSNVERKREILDEILTIIDQTPSDKTRKALMDSQFFDALEYGRVVHAEMSAISDAARTGRAIKDGILYCTTFPCHLCAKHIVASGLKRVVFLEPYPKSLVSRLHDDSIRIEEKERGKYQAYPCVEFEHFSGITPRRFDQLFRRVNRKSEHSGNFEEYQHNRSEPVITIRTLVYITIEKAMVENTLGSIFDTSLTPSARPASF